MTFDRFCCSKDRSANEVPDVPMASQSLESVPPVDTPPVPPPVVPETTERPESVPMNTHQEGILQKKV